MLKILHHKSCNILFYARIMVHGALTPLP